MIRLAGVPKKLDTGGSFLKDGIKQSGVRGKYRQQMPNESDIQWPENPGRRIVL